MKQPKFDILEMNRNFVECLELPGLSLQSYSDGFKQIGEMIHLLIIIKTKIDVCPNSSECSDHSKLIKIKAKFGFYITDFPYEKKSLIKGQKIQGFKMLRASP